MPLTRDQIQTALDRIALPDGGTLVSRDMLRAVMIDGDKVSFVIEAPSPELARRMEPVRAAAENAVRALGATQVSALLTAHGPSAPKPAGQSTGQPVAQSAPGGPPPSLKIGGHPTPQAGPTSVPGVERVIAIASGKGGVGKSTVSSNLAVALARQGRRVGLLDADIYGPSQPRMMGLSGRPDAPDGKTIIPLVGHGVKVMSMGLLLKETESVVWRGPMLMGALQQLLGQVAWAPLDVLIIDLPPGTGDVQLTLCQKTNLTGAIVVSTPQDVALMDARRAIDMFEKLKTPVLGLIENMSTYICPNCGHEAHLFGHGGVHAEAAATGIPFLGEIPLSLDIRLAGDGGKPVALGDGPEGQAYAKIARRLVEGGMA